MGKRPVTEEEIAGIKADYDRVWKRVENSAVAFGFEESTVPESASRGHERCLGVLRRAVEAVSLLVSRL